MKSGKNQQFGFARRLERFHHSQDRIVQTLLAQLTILFWGL
jgi:hypothetical protein